MKSHTRTPRGSEPAGKGGSPRERTLSHLDTLLRGATALGTGAVLAWSSRADAQRPPQVCDPLPPPVNCKAPETFRLDQCVAQHTRWKKTPGAWTLEFTLWTLSFGERYRSLPDMTPPAPQEPPADQPAERVTFAGVTRDDITVTGATLVSAKATAGRIDMILAPDIAGQPIRVALPNPADRSKRFAVLLDVTKPPAEGESVPVRLAPAAGAR